MPVWMRLEMWKTVDSWLLFFLFRIVQIHDFGYTELETHSICRTFVTAGEIINVGSLLGRTDFYTYHGSLTTPPCSETVTRDTTDNQYVNFRGLRSSLWDIWHCNLVRGILGKVLRWSFSGSIRTMCTKESKFIERDYL